MKGRKGKEIMEVEEGREKTDEKGKGERRMGR